MMSEAGTGFSRGFFGCFGVLAAVVLVVVIVASMGRESPTRKTSEREDKQADAIVACGLALLAAERSGSVGNSSQLQVPWRVYEMGEGQGVARRVSCAAVDDRGEMGVIVDVVCTDVNDPKCHPLVKIARP